MSREHSDPASEYMVNRILPLREIHLIAGPSGAGKTTWLFQFIQDWRAGKPILGYESYPKPFVYVACDRTLVSAQRTLERLKIDPDQFGPIVSVLDHKEWLGKQGPTVLTPAVPVWDRVVEHVCQHHPEARALFVDGFTSLTPGGKINDYGIVSSFLIQVVSTCVKHDLTVLGLAHASKTKQDQKYINPRQRVVGSSAWAGFSETIFFIEPNNPEDPSVRTRDLFVLPRNAPEQKFQLEVTTDGMLAFVDEPTTDGRSISVLRAKLAGYSDGDEIEAAEMAKWGLSKTSLYRSLESLIEQGEIEKGPRGRYRKPTLN